MMRDKILTVCRRIAGWLRSSAKTWREAIRTLLLLILAAGVVIQSGLLWSHALTRDSIPWSGLHARFNASEPMEAGIDNNASAMPIRFAARSENGLYGTQYNIESLRTAYEETAGVWAQALSNAEQPMPANTRDYRNALKHNLLLMEYDGRIPLYVIAGWLDCTVQEEWKNYELGAIALCETGDNTYELYLRDNSAKLVYARTTVNNNTFDAAAELFEPNHCVLAAEEKNKAVSPDLLYFQESQTFDVLEFHAYSGKSNIDILLEAFGLHAAAAEDSLYTTSGAQTYVSGRNRVQIEPDGGMQYDGTSIRLPILSYGDNRLLQCIQTGAELTNAALEAISCSDSAALIDAYTDTGSGRYIAVYGVQSNGIPIDNSETGYFARYEFEGNTMVHADLALRVSQAVGEQVAVMPERQAAASLTENVDALLSLRYVDSARGTNSSWVQLDWDTEYGDSSTAEQVVPTWYILNGSKNDLGNKLDIDEIVVVRADFDRLIRGGGVS